MRVHDRERGAAFREPFWQLGAPSMALRQVLDDVARRRDERLVAVLLEEHPLQRLRAAEAIARHEPRALGQIPEDRVRLGQMRAVVELERWYPPIWIALQKLRRARGAGIDVELGPGVAHAELRKQQPDLVAVAGI